MLAGTVSHKGMLEEDSLSHTRTHSLSLSLTLSLTLSLALSLTLARSLSLSLSLALSDGNRLVAGASRASAFHQSGLLSSLGDLTKSLSS